MNKRPSISVCMAAYNGEAFITEQIASILGQLGPEDELVIVDDASTDGTVAKICTFNDPRVRLVRHKNNLGVVDSFEQSITSSHGEIIFLSDMDDRWSPTKVAKFLDVFASRPDVALVISSMRLIDDEGEYLDSNRRIRRPFSPSFFANLIENTYQGSNMAFRRELLEDLVPFPKKKRFLHDSWIGTRASLLRAGIVYIDEPLLDYRVHASNFSGKLGFLEKIELRLQLLTAHAQRLLKRPHPKTARGRGQARY